MEIRAHAVIEWVNTFSISQPCSELEDLSDGIALAEMLAEIADPYFNMASIRRDVGNNWALALNNLKKVVSNLDGYYHDVLGRDAADKFAAVDLTAVAKDRDPAHTLALVRLLVGAAVMCADRARYIGAIMQMPVESQAVLQPLIQEAIAQAPSFEASAEGGGDNGDGGGAGGESEAAVNAEERAAAAEAAAADAAAALAEERAEREALRREVAALKEKLQLESASASARSAAGDRAGKLARNVEDLKGMVEEKEAEADELRQQMEGLERKRDQEARQRATLEMELRQMADELDIAQAKAQQLTKAEAMVEKYKRRLDELAALRSEKAQLEASNSKYLDQVLELEGEVEELRGSKKRIEYYKDQAVELERQKFEATCAASLKDAENDRLKKELDVVNQAKMFLEDELTALREQATASTPRGSAGTGGGGGADGNASGGSGSELGLFENSAELRERAARLQRENAMLKAKIGDGEGGGGSTEQVQLLQSQLDDALRMREERSAVATAAQTRVEELETDIRKLREHVTHMERDEARARELGQENQRLRGEVEVATALKMALDGMEGKLKEKETELLAAKSELDKMQIYAKKMVEVLKKKSAEANESIARKLAAEKEKIENLEAKIAADRAMWKKEERLLVSAVYEMGLEGIDFRNREAANPEGDKRMPWLQRQRAQAKRSNQLNL